MGLDMYVFGRRQISINVGGPGEVEIKPILDKNEGKEELAYWRKHPNLHGYIVTKFANGVDECQEIPLDKAKIEIIMAAVRENKLPETTGFFFGTSDGTETEEDLKSFTKILEWLDTKEENPTITRSVYYRASW